MHILLHRDRNMFEQIHTTSSVCETQGSYRLSEPGYYYLSDTGEFSKCAELPSMNRTVPVAVVTRPCAPLAADRFDKY